MHASLLSVRALTALFTFEAQIVKTFKKCLAEKVPAVWSFSEQGTSSSPRFTLTLIIFVRPLSRCSLPFLTFFCFCTFGLLIGIYFCLEPYICCFQQTPTSFHNFSIFISFHSSSSDFFFFTVFSFFLFDFDSIFDFYCNLFIIFIEINDFPFDQSNKFHCDLLVSASLCLLELYVSLFFLFSFSFFCLISFLSFVCLFARFYSVKNLLTLLFVYYYPFIMFENTIH